MTTRSTHPWTFYSLTALLQSLGLGQIEVINPHSHQTKGELVRQALEGSSTELLELAASTVSCAKLNAGRPAKGNPNYQCGVCIACFVRRAAFLGAGIPDHTEYTANGPNELARQVQKLRRHDINAWRRATTDGIPEHRILGSGLWPPGIDLAAVLTICSRGLQELSLVSV